MFGIAFLFGLNYWKAQNNKVPVAPPALKVYYDSMFNLDKTLDRYEKEFELGVGGLPTVGEFQDRLEPNNSKRFLSNTERILKQVEDDLTTVYAMQDSVPAGAEAHYAAIKTKLEERQRYYARLKDAVEQKNQDRWKAAFDGLPALRDANAKEEDALNDLQALVLKPVQITPKS
ncbi:MAG TPA: hypothetical protein VH186_18980 [Chloroflexia bacterium]|nr:hypothetical protein [Chloroflexia bacterium]